MKFISILLAIGAWTLTGCAGSGSHVMLDRAVILNETPIPVHDVEVHHEPTDRVGGVSIIPPGRALDLWLPTQPMLADTSVVTWRQGGKPRSVRVDLPEDRAAARSGEVMTLVYTIENKESVSVALVPSGAP